MRKRDSAVSTLRFPEAERRPSEAAVFSRGASDLDPGLKPEGAAGPQSAAPRGQAGGGKHRDRQVAARGPI